MNELTFAGWLVEFTAVRAASKENALDPALITSAAIEERQDDADGRPKRCDIRFNSASGRKLVSGELKRPEVPEGRDPRNEKLRDDARRKAIARGLPYYLTCNIATVVLYAVALRPREVDEELKYFDLAPITNSGQAVAYKIDIGIAWNAFLDFLEAKLSAIVRTRPTVTTADVIAVRNAMYAVEGEVFPRVLRRVLADPTISDELRMEAYRSFNFSAALSVSSQAQLREELIQIIRFGIFVVAQKLILYRVLEDAGPRRSEPFHLDQLSVPANSSNPSAIRAVLDQAFALATKRSEDYETAFQPQPFVDLIFSNPEGTQESKECRIGQVWSDLLAAIGNVSWLSISQNIVGLLYEIIVEERFRHSLGQFYTPEDVVDFLTTFAIRSAGDLVLDPAAGGGSFLRSSYHRKRDLGESHPSVLSTIWGIEVTAFAAELSTVTLVSSDTTEAAAYPRVLLRDFFEIRPGLVTDLKIPGELDQLKVPGSFDAIVGNPPYISYRRLTNHTNILNALAESDPSISMPRFTGKSDAYLWFIVHATQFLRTHGRLGFVVSSAILFSDYGVPLVRFIGHHYKIMAVVESAVERWFPDADTNTVLLLLEREIESVTRSDRQIRFVRLKRPLAQLLPDPNNPLRRDELEALVQSIITSPATEDDPRMQVNLVSQGDDGGLDISFFDVPPLLDSENVE